MPMFYRCDHCGDERETTEDRDQPCADCGTQICSACANDDNLCYDCRADKNEGPE